MCSLEGWGGGWGAGGDVCVTVHTDLFSLLKVCRVLADILIHSVRE